MKKLLSLLLAASVLCSLGASAAVAAEPDGPVFLDVPEDSWYHLYVYAAVRQGLILGQSPTRFAPEDNLTQAEAMVLASRSHQLLTGGEVTLAPGNPWYRPYLDYADSNFLEGWLEVGAWDEAAVSKPITREYFVELFYLALEESGYEPINVVADGSIPDVPMSSDFSGAVYAFYRAGILAGSDVKRTFNPQSNITRAEVAAILARITNSSPRMRFSLPAQEPAGAGDQVNTFTAFVYLDKFVWGEYGVYGSTAKYYMSIVLMLDRQDRELLEQYGIDPDGLENDYAIISLDEEDGVAYDYAPGIQYYVFFDTNEPYDVNPRFVDQLEFEEYMHAFHRAEYGILAEVSVADGLVVSITEIYRPWAPMP